MKVLIFIMVCFQVCFSVNPGFKLRITKKGVGYANQVAQAMIAAQLKDLKIPDQSGSGHHISWSITNVRVTGVTAPTSAIALNPRQNGATWSLSNFGISIHCDWRVKYKRGWVKASTSGSVDVSVKRVSLVETVGFGIDKSGRPSIASKGCSDNVGDVDIHFHGGTAWILNLFKGTFEDKVKGMLQDKICEEVVTAVNVNAEQDLQKMKVNVEIDHRFLLDYSLVSAPSITADYGEIAGKGEVYWEKDKKESPFSPSPLPPSKDYSNMVYIWLSDYMANSFLYQAKTHRYLEYNVTKNDLPPDQKSYLNTTCTLKCIGTILPQIRKKYPNSDVEMHVKATAVPKAVFATGNLTTSLQADVELWAHTPDNKKHYMLTLNMNVSFTVKAAIKNERVAGSIIDHSFTSKVTKSAIGPLPSQALNMVLNGVLSFAVIPELNEIAARGIDLPITDQVKFLNAKLLLQQGALLITTDVQYKVVEHPAQNGDNTLYFEGENGKVEQPNIQVSVF